MVYFNILVFLLLFFIIHFRSRVRHYSFFQKKLFTINTLEKVKPLIFIFICALALFSRLYKFPNIPAGINQDEAMAAINAKALLTYGRDITGLKFPVYLPAWGTSQMNILESLMMIPAVSVLGMNALSARLPMLLVNLISIIVLYDFTKRLFGKDTAVLCAFLISINPWHIMLSRWGLESNLLPACVLCGFYFLYRGAAEGKTSLLYVSMIFWGASMYAYGIAYFATPFILVVSAVYFIKNKQIGMKALTICFAIYLIISLPIFLMILVNFLKLSTIDLGLFTIPYFPDQVRMNDMIFGSGDFVDQARNNFLYIVRNILQFPDVPWNLTPEFGTLYIFSLPPLIYGFIKMKSADTADFLLKLWLSAAFLTGMIINTAGTNQMNILFIPLIVLCAIGLNNLSHGYRAADNGIRLIDLSPIAAYIIAFALFMSSYFGVLPGYSTLRFYDGFGEAVSAADRSGSSRVYVTSWTQNENAAHVSEVLTLYHCDIDSAYYRGESPENAVPYSERYQYIRFTNTPEYEDAAIYVINAGGDGYLFPDTEFYITVYGEYAVATRR